MVAENDERWAWDRAWASMPHRRLLAIPKVADAEAFALEFRAMVSATISLVPAEYSDKPWRPTDTCPVCGATTLGMDRLAATLHPKFASGLSYGLGVWVHPLCFEKCPETEEPTPIPW